MRLSFDLDDTLVTRIHSWTFEPGLPGFREDSEYLRLGTVELFNWIRQNGHEIWIYTNSYRGFKNLTDWFTHCNIPVDQAINQVLHDEARMKLDPRNRVQKFPPWFEIDMHFDDLDELASVDNIFQVLPTDDNWVETIKNYIVRNSQ